MLVMGVKANSEWTIVMKHWKELIINTLLFIACLSLLLLYIDNLGIVVYEIMYMYTHV